MHTGSTIWRFAALQYRAAQNPSWGGEISLHYGVAPRNKGGSAVLVMSGYQFLLIEPSAGNELLRYQSQHLSAGVLLYSEIEGGRKNQPANIDLRTERLRRRLLRALYYFLI